MSLKAAVFNSLGKLFSLLSGKELYYYSKNSNNALGKTAVKSSLGFWYVGNVLSPQDLAYGILNNGVVEPEGTYLVKSMLEYLLSQKDRINFYDIGANSGYYGVMAAYIGQGKVITRSFEPVKEYNQAEEETLKLNRLSDFCHVYNIALGDKQGPAKMYISGTGSTLLHEFIGHKKVEEREIHRHTLDSFILQANLAGPDFIKIDVEGSEHEVLQGSIQTITESRPIIWYESALKISDRNFFNNKFFNTPKFLQTLGYKIYLTEGKQILSFEDSFNQDGVKMFLAVPQENRGMLEYLKAQSYEVR